MEIFLPILRADFKMMENYSYREESPLACAISAFGGLSDPKIDRGKIISWRIHTSREFSSYFFPGGHFFLQDAEPFLLDQINLHLKESIP